MARRATAEGQQLLDLAHAPAADVDAVLAALGPAARRYSRAYHGKLRRSNSGYSTGSPRRTALTTVHRMQLLRSLLFTASSCCSPSATPSSSRWPRCCCRGAGRFVLATLWANVLMAALRVICGLGYRVEGRENLPTDQACIALVKHSSSWETVAQAAILPPQVWVLKRELMWIPFIGWGLRALRAIAINRGGGGCGRAADDRAGTQAPGGRSLDRGVPGGYAHAARADAPLRRGRLGHRG